MKHMVSEEILHRKGRFPAFILSFLALGSNDEQKGPTSLAELMFSG